MMASATVTDCILNELVGLNQSHADVDKNVIHTDRRLSHDVDFVNLKTDVTKQTFLSLRDLLIVLTEMNLYLIRKQ